MRRALPFSGAIAVILLGGVLLDSARARATPPLPQTLGASPELGAPIHATLLLQKADCTGNLRMLQLLSPAATERRLALQRIWFTGQATDSSAIRSALPAWAGTVPIEHIPAHALKALRQLGHRSTPVLIVQDQEGRLRFVSQSPRSAREFAGLRRIVQSLTWIDEL
jgi:hypothetical protein